jgi:NAD(P)-dependent dehydrogenase (short-subunit alcohol dehydrogenase family)
MSRKAIVTGAYGAIGRAISEGLANNGYHVFLVGRDLTRLDETRNHLIRKTSNHNIFAEEVDLSSKNQIIAFSKRFVAPLDILINNAATAPKRRTETSEGIETQWSVNVLAYFRMIQHFHPLMIKQPDARIVNVASYWAGGLDLQDPEFKSRPYDNDSAYRQAKQANRMLTVAHAEILKPHCIAVNACHPGDVNSKLSNAFGFGGHESPEEGAATPLYLALSDEIKDLTGLYYEHLKPVACQFSKDRNAVQKLYNLCADQ